MVPLGRRHDAGALVGLGCAWLLDEVVGYGNVTVTHMASIGVVFALAMKGTSYINQRGANAEHGKGGG